MDDYNARRLLRLLHLYVKEYGEDTPKTVADLAADLAMSLDVTTGEEDQIRRYIEEVLA